MGMIVVVYEFEKKIVLSICVKGGEMFEGIVFEEILYLILWKTWGVFLAAFECCKMKLLRGWIKKIFIKDIT